MTNAPWRGHEPVLLSEVLAVFDTIGPGDGVFVDATLGGGGHAEALLAEHPRLRLVGLDQDPDAVAAATAQLAASIDRVTILHRRFDALADTLDELAVEAIVGVLFDLGVSSHQLDAGERGFSYRADGPLDMRMDPGAGVRGADQVVNGASEGELSTILREYGDERYATRIARAIVGARPISGTAQLAEIVREAIPAPARRRGGHPARRTFQALRIAVNDELRVLSPALDQAIDRLVPQGRGVVLTYHSGEDRIVKQHLRDAAGRRSRSHPGLPPAPGTPGPRVRLLAAGGRTPGAAELERNPRARSARLRAFEKLAEQVCA